MAQTLTITVRQRIGGQVSPFSAPVVVTVGGQAEAPTGGAAAGMSDAEKLTASEAPLSGAGAGDQAGGVAVMKEVQTQGAGAGTSEADSVQAGGTSSYSEPRTDGAAAGTVAAGSASSSDARADGAAAGTSEADTYTAGGGPSLIDDFSTNSIASYTKIGSQPSTWAVAAGKLDQNFVDFGDATVDRCVRTGSSLGDGIVRGTLKFSSDFDMANGGRVELIARWGDASNLISALITPIGLQLWQVVSGASSQLGSTYSFTPAANTDYVVEIGLSGGNVTVKLGGTQRISATTTRTAAGAYGFGTQRGSWDDGTNFHTNPGTAYFDDLYAG